MSVAFDLSLVRWRFLDDPEAFCGNEFRCAYPGRVRARILNEEDGSNMS